MKNRILMLMPVALAVLLSSCQTYQPLDFEPEKLFEEVNRGRARPLSEAKTLQFSDAAATMDENNLSLAVVKKEYEGAMKVADIKTPWPNPSIGFGPAFGTNLEDSASSAVQPFVALGVSIPLGPRLIRNNELNEITAIQAFNKVVLRHRDLYFRLRSAFTRYAASTQILNAHDAVAESFAKTRSSTKRLVELGSISSLGLTEADLQAAEIRVVRLKLQAENESSATMLGRLMAIDTEEVRSLVPAALPNWPIIPELEQLKRLLLVNNGALSDIEMEFKVSDAELRLELARQYPDLSIGVDVEDEVGESKRSFGVPLGIDLPVFDRNRQGIAAARNRRELQLLSYRSELSGLLSDLEEEYTRLQFVERKLALFEQEILPAAKKNTTAGQRAMKLGSIDVLRYLELVSQLRNLEIEYAELNGERWDALISLEELVGLPLVNLMPDELSPLKESLNKLETE